MYVCNYLQDENGFSLCLWICSSQPPLSTHKESMKTPQTNFFLNLIKENVMKELFAGALSKRPIEIKLTPIAVWGQNKNSGLLSEYTSVIETTGISLNHEIVVYSGSTASNERRGARP